jgi:hypothetical protein
MELFDEITWTTRSWWRRLERRARIAFERDLLAALREVAETRSPVVAIDIRRDTTLGFVRLTLPGRTLMLAGLEPNAVRPLRGRLLEDMPLWLTRAGRYGRLWWVALTDGDSETVIGGLHVRLTNGGGGQPVDDAGLSGGSRLHHPPSGYRYVISERSPSRCA